MEQSIPVDYYSVRPTLCGRDVDEVDTTIDLSMFLSLSMSMRVATEYSLFALHFQCIFDFVCDTIVLRVCREHFPGYRIIYDMFSNFPQSNTAYRKRGWQELCQPFRLQFRRRKPPKARKTSTCRVELLFKRCVCPHHDGALHEQKYHVPFVHHLVGLRSYIKRDVTHTVQTLIP